MDEGILDFLIRWVWAPIAVLLAVVFRLLYILFQRQEATDKVAELHERRIALVERDNETAENDRKEIKQLLRDHNAAVHTEIAGLRTDMNDRFGSVEEAVRDAIRSTAK